MGNPSWNDTRRARSAAAITCCVGGTSLSLCFSGLTVVLLLLLPDLLVQTGAPRESDPLCMQMAKPSLARWVAGAVCCLAEPQSSRVSLAQMQLGWGTQNVVRAWPGSMFIFRFFKGGAGYFICGDLLLLGHGGLTYMLLNSPHRTEHP